MTSIPELASIFILAVIAGALLPFAVRPILHRNNMVDIPNERSSRILAASDWCAGEC